MNAARGKNDIAMTKDEKTETWLRDLLAAFPEHPPLLQRLEEANRATGSTDLHSGEMYDAILAAVSALKRACGQAFGIEPVQAQPNYGNNGVLDSLMTAARLIPGAPEGGVLVPSPTYFHNHRAAAARGLKLRLVPPTADLRFDAATFLRRMEEERPALALLVSPNNPTGIAIPDDELLAVLDRLPAGTWGVLDRTLVNASPEVSTPALLHRYRDRPLVILHSFSKYKRLSHQRIGVALYSNPDFARAVEPFLPLGLGLEGCLRAWQCVTEDGGIVADPSIVRNIRLNRECLDAFSRQHPRFSITDFSGNFCLLRLPDGLRSQAITEWLASQGMMVMGGHGLAEPDASVLRIHVGSPLEDVRRLCDLLARA